jgi:hypothetical protein
VVRTIKDRYGNAWGRYGFVDAFNPLKNWYDIDVVGIDTGITLVMIENARTSFVWDTFMKNPEARRGMDRAGFKSSQPSPLQESEGDVPVPRTASQDTGANSTDRTRPNPQGAARQGVNRQGSAQ